MLFSEPKIPQSELEKAEAIQRLTVSVLFSEPKIPQCNRLARNLHRTLRFQCSSASRKFLNLAQIAPELGWSSVSVLFSEPKIPQSITPPPGADDMSCFSALQRAENSSIDRRGRRQNLGHRVSVLFSEPKIPQCTVLKANLVGKEVSVLFSEPKIPQSRCSRSDFASSRVSVLFSEPKIPQLRWTRHKLRNDARFSALQRAENSSIRRATGALRSRCCFSALQRAENSSIIRVALRVVAVARVSVLFSEPKIPQSSSDRTASSASSVSVLFSEPKIPQFLYCKKQSPFTFMFQCSSASRKFLNPDPRTCVHPYFRPRRSRFVISEPSWCVAMTPVY